MRSLVVVSSTVLVLLLALTAPLPAQFLQQGGKLPASGALGVPSLGVSAVVSADGNTAILGGSTDNSYAGAAWVYTRINGLWSPTNTKLTGTGAVGAAEQGLSVAISADGNTAILGGPFDNAATGAVWIFTRTGGTWSQQGAKLTGTGAQGMALQGASVAISADGNTAAVGGPLDASGVGALWIFTRAGSVWTQQGARLKAADAVGLAAQGTSVALSSDGNTVTFGGPADSNGVGAAWIFTRAGGVWTQQGNKLVGSAAANPAQQGTAVAISADGNTLLSGGPGDTNGAVWVFTRTGSVWTQQGAKLTGAGAIGATSQGWVSLSGDGNTAIVGAPTYSTSAGPLTTGAAWAFSRTNGVWTRSANPLVGTFAIGASAQGTSVAISADGSAVVVGAPGDSAGVGAGWTFGPIGVPSVVGVTPPAGSGTAQTFSFTFSDTGGAARLTVLNILINNVLDGRLACYLAFVPGGSTTGLLYLVDNAGNAGGPYTQIFVGSSQPSGVVQNGQCAVTAAGSSVTPNGNNLTVTLPILFSPSFAGNKVVYLAARQFDVSSSWHAGGTFNIPGPAISGPAVSGMNPPFGTSASQVYTFTFTDSNGWQDIGVANILVNNTLDGKRACYLAYIPAGAATGMLHLLVDNPVDAGGPFTNLNLPGAGTVSNSQCTISGTGSSVTASGNTLTLTLPITFSAAFAGDRIFYLAARNTTLNSGWQSVGTVVVP